MREKNRKPIANNRKRLPQFTTMNVIDGQAGLIICSSLIFYSLTIDNILNIIVLLILAGVSIATLTGENGILTRATDASEKTDEANAEEQVQIAVVGSIGADGKLENGSLKDNLNQIENISGVPEEITDSSYPITVTVDGKYSYVIDKDGTIREVVKREGIEIGDYLNYTYDTKTEGYNLLATQSGYTSDQTVGQTTGLKWRILNIHTDGTVYLISETVPSGDVYFSGALGYNNGVYLINDICKELYSNSTLGVEARSIDLEDIESQMNETGIEARDGYNNGVATYGDTKTYTGDYNNYPNLYAEENGSGIDLTGETEEERKEQVKKNGIEVSEDGYSSPTTETSSKASNSLTVTQSYYYFSNTPASYFKDYDGSNSIVRDMIFNTGTNYWLASRYARCYSTDVDFGLRFVNYSNLHGDKVFNSSGTPYSCDYHVRPIVSLGYDIEIKACEGENSSTNMHEISK